MGTGRIQDLARALSREDFAKRLPSHFLVITDSGEDEPPSSFETVDASTTPRALLAARPSLEVHEIVKAKDNPYQDRISLGRTRNCDVVLRQPSVSKLHANFHRREDGALDIVDVGSQIGTRVNGRPLMPNKPERIAPGFFLMIGRVAARVTDARGVWDLLKAQEKLDESPVPPPAPPGSNPRGSAPPGSVPRAASPSGPPGTTRSRS